MKGGVSLITHARPRERIALHPLQERTYTQVCFSRILISTMDSKKGSALDGSLTIESSAGYLMPYSWSRAG